MDLAFASSEQHEKEREGSGERKRGVEAPANARGVADKHVRKPDRDRGGADIHEEAERQKIANERQVPGPFLEEAFNLHDEECDEQISNEERSGAAGIPGRGLLEHGQQRQQDDGRARENDLPFEVLPIRLIGAHARGRVSCPFSLTSRRRFVARRYPVCNGCSPAREEKMSASGTLPGSLAPGEPARSVASHFSARRN